jgi:NAD(P)-dependent dehydrogenase (short-subunit alcohol dehydrogenase family)
MSQAFAEHGATVVVASRKVEACEEAAAEISQSTGREAVGLGCHVGEWEQCDRLVERVYDRFGRVDVLVNNAGMSPTYSALTDVTQELFDKVIAVNLRGPFRLSSLVGARMVDGGGGSVINVSSVAAVIPTATEVPYAAAKAGLNNLTMSLARALAPKVRVNCIMAGPFLTDISRAWDMDAFERNAAKVIPLGRGGRPEEIVGAALYLASDAASFTTGSILKVDGGYAHASS